ncbi:aminodeoxychorismate synthase component I [Brevibacterium sp.]|uniref:aminodeoxychorismate synthase component I n=1 Tax=Brevibacterium sp. TaxID=1701 RepID=UPI0025BB804F|nr:aminodeoxychorismate synthase component I [Brevibacterium sp.]
MPGIQPALRVLVVDNYDSFTHNLVHQITRVTGAVPRVVPHDWTGWESAVLDSVDAVVVSPGPGTPEHPEDMGISADVIAEALARGTVPVLGVCLGHQGIAHALGAAVVRAPEPRHGRTSPVRHAGEGVFAGLPDPFTAVRYHSLVVEEGPRGEVAGTAGVLRVTARADDGTVMGLAHTELPLWGVQFHPESVLAEHGDRLLENFARLAREHAERRSVREMRSARPAPDHGERTHAAPPLPEHSGLGCRTPVVQEAPRTAPLLRTLTTAAAPEQIFHALYGAEDCAVWLDGNLPGDPRGCFSVMGAPSGPGAARAWADVSAGTVTVQRRGRSPETLRTGFFDWLEAELRGQDTVAEVVDGCSFALGWVGCLGYELKAECGGVSTHRAETPDAAFVFLDRAVVWDAETSSAHLLALPDGGAAGSAQRWLEETAAVIRGLGPDTSAEPPAGGRQGARTGSPALRARHSQDDYLSLIAEVQELIAAGETYEACLTNELGVELAGAVDPWVTYLRLRRRNPAPFGAFLRFPELGDREAFTVMSTSPERFLRIDAEGRAESSPIKGTRPRGRTGAEDAGLREELLTAEKDRSENLMIVDLVRNDLGRVAEAGTVHVERLFAVESYATVHQLVSTVSARLAADRSSVECVRAAFPPGSMTGAPKVRTMALLDALEGGPRGVYSGALGWFSLSGAVDLSVVIRTLVHTGNRLSSGVGGAIVALSDPDEEYAETQVKAAPLLRLLKEEEEGV